MDGNLDVLAYRQGGIMGSNYIHGFFEAGLDFDSVLEMHCFHNLYPPMKKEFLPAIKQAIECVALENYYEKVELPAGSWVSADIVVDTLYLWDFIGYLTKDE